MVTGTIYTQSNKTIENVVDTLNFCLQNPMTLTIPGSLLGEMIRRIKPSLRINTLWKTLNTKTLNL